MKTNKRYMCVMGFEVPLIDDSGQEIEGKHRKIKEGEVWIERSPDVRMIGEEVGLIKSNGEWLEIPKISLEMFFEEMEE